MQLARQRRSTEQPAKVDKRLQNARRELQVNISTNPTINATAAIVRMLVFRQPPFGQDAHQQSEEGDPCNRDTGK